MYRWSVWFAVIEDEAVFIGQPPARGRNLDRILLWLIYTWVFVGMCPLWVWFSAIIWPQIVKQQIDF